MNWTCDFEPDQKLLDLARSHAGEAEDWFCVYQCATSIDQARRALQSAMLHLQSQFICIDRMIPPRRLNDLDHSAAELILRRERNKNSLRLYNSNGRGTP